VARGLEAEWDRALQALSGAEAELASREKARPATLTGPERAAILALGNDLGKVWHAPTTTDKDRKQLLRTLLEEVAITVHRDQAEGRAELMLRWKGGAISELTVPLKRQPPKNRTSEDTVDLVCRLAVHYADDMIASMLNKQGRTTATGMSFTTGRVQSLRHHWGIPRHQPSDDQPEGEQHTVADAARQLGLAPSTLHRWVNDGFVPGEQLTPGAPWRIRMTGQLRGIVHRRRPRRLAARPRSHPRPRRLPPDPDATCQARRAARRPRPHRTRERPAHPATPPPKTACSDSHNQQRSSVMHTP
jgi:transposase-like protein